MSGLAVPLVRVQDAATQAWSDAFVAVGHGLPHPDDNPDGIDQGARRDFVLELLARFARHLGELSVEEGLWSDVPAFMATLDGAEGAP